MRITKGKFKNHYRISFLIPKHQLWIIVALLIALLSFFTYRWLTTPAVIVSPIPEEETVVTPTPTQAAELEAKEEARKNGRILEGWATFYEETIEGCRGCRPHYDENGQLYFVMANGQRLDDEAFTVACNDFPLGTKVVVQKVDEEGGGRIVTATVTDRHGANIVVDMTKAVRDSIGCQGKCWVKVWPL